MFAILRKILFNSYKIFQKVLIIFTIISEFILFISNLNYNEDKINENIEIPGYDNV